MEITKNVKFNLFATCKIVEGATKGVIADLHRNKLYPVPLSLCHVLTFAGKLTVDEVLDEIGQEHRQIILEYFKFLINYDLVFFNDQPENFPSLLDYWDEPFRVTNSIIDFKNYDENRILSISKSIGNEPIKSIQFRLFCEVDLKELSFIIDNINPAGLNSIEIILCESSKMTIDDLLDLCLVYARIFTVIVYGADEELYQKSRDGIMGQIFTVKDAIYSEKDCGQIGPNFFTVNMKTFMESVNHNSCLNRKLSVDSNGQIKNCPSMSTSFGSVEDVTFGEVLEMPKISEKWFLSKKMVQTCKDCEFRFICTDCRAYIEDPNDIHSKPLKCGYDPYTGKWSDWKLSKKNKKVFEYYDLTTSTF